MSVCYVVGRRVVYVTLLEGGECMLHCYKEVSVGYVVIRRWSVCYVVGRR